MAILLAVVAADYLDIEVGLLFAGAAAAASTPLGLSEHELVVAPFAIGLCAASSSCVQVLLKIEVYTVRLTLLGKSLSMDPLSVEHYILVLHR
jgi:hypothetical protein